MQFKHNFQQNRCTKKHEQVFFLQHEDRHLVLPGHTFQEVDFWAFLRLKCFGGDGNAL